MATLGSLALMLSASSGNLEKRLRSARKSLAAFGSGIVKVGKQVAKWGSIVAAAGAAFATFMIGQQMKQIDALAKMSDQLGVSTEKLTAWRHAADLTGVSSGALDSGLQRLTRVLGDARTGSAAAQKALMALGITAKEIQSLNAEQMFERVSNAIGGIEDPAKRASAAYAIFGRQGQGLMNFFKQGKRAMDENAESAKKLGLTFSRDLGAQVEMANDNMTRMMAAVTGLFRQLAPVVAKYITVITDSIVSWITAGDGVPGMAKAVESAFTSSVGAMVDFAQKSALVFQIIVSRLQESAAWVVGGVTKAIETITNLMRHVPGMELLSGALPSAETFERHTKGAASALLEAQQRSIKIEDALSALNSGIEKSWADKLNESLANVEKRAKDIAKAVNSAQSIAENKTQLEKSASFWGEKLRTAARMGISAAANFSMQALQNAKNRIMSEVRSSVSTTGISGGFSGAAASRSDSVQTVAMSSLTEAKQQTELLRRIENHMQGGFPAG